MTTFLRLKLYGYTVRGIDLNDNNSPFKDHVVFSNYDCLWRFGTMSHKERIDYIKKYYLNLKLQTDEQSIIPDFEDDRVTVSLDLHKLYMERIKEMVEQREKEKEERDGIHTTV